MTETALLTVAEVDSLAECEKTIERGLNTFVEVGNALLTIRDGRLYRAEYGTFEEYCQTRWGFNRHRASQLISAAGVVTNVTSEGLPAPANEGQARELARVPEEQRADVWRETVERTNGKPTAAAIRQAYQPEPPAEPAPAPVSDAALLAGADWTPSPEPVTPPPAPESAAPAWTEEEIELQRRLTNGETVVVSMRDGRHSRLIEWADQRGLYVRIDRRSPWGNPFELGADGDRATVITNYADHYLPYKPSLLDQLDTLTGKALGCWCAPDPCHGDVLAEASQQ